MNYAGRKALIERERPYVMEQVEHMRKKGYSFSDWIVLFVHVEEDDEDAKKLAGALGEKGSINALVRRDELQKVLKAHKLEGADLIAQPVQPGKLRCVVYGMGCGFDDIDIPASVGN